MSEFNYHFRKWYQIENANMCEVKQLKLKKDLQWYIIIPPDSGELKSQFDSRAQNTIRHGAA